MTNEQKANRHLRLIVSQDSEDIDRELEPAMQDPFHALQEGVLEAVSRVARGEPFSTEDIANIFMALDADDALRGVHQVDHQHLARPTIIRWSDDDQ